MNRLLSIALLLLSGCATPPWYAQLAERDPDRAAVVRHLHCEDFVVGSEGVRAKLIGVRDTTDDPHVRVVVIATINSIDTNIGLVPCGYTTR